MSNVFCYNCNRIVGVTKRRSCGTIGLVVVFFILGLIIPLWFISLPILWGLAIVIFLLSGVQSCTICGGTRIDKDKNVYSESYESVEISKETIPK